MKGVVHTLEAVIAIGMLLVAVLGLFKPLPVADNSAMLAQSGYAALQYLEDSGELRPALAAKSVETIRAALQPLLSDFELEICNPDCSGTQQRAIAIDYFISGYQAYQPVHLRLYLIR